nr:MAG TPA: hypothetical protein [Caudoviricetes sp.]
MPFSVFCVDHIPNTRLHTESVEAVILTVKFSCL